MTGTDKKSFGFKILKLTSVNFFKGELRISERNDVKKKKELLKKQVFKHKKLKSYTIKNHKFNS